MYNIGNNKKRDLHFLVIHEASKQTEISFRTRYDEEIGLLFPIAKTEGSTIFRIESIRSIEGSKRATLNEC